MVLYTGRAVPDVTAKNQDGETVSPDFQEPTVVFFYPRDGTRGCTLEAREFEAEMEWFSEAGVTVYGVSTDDVESHREFAEEEGLSFDLLADPDGEVAAAFDLETTGGFVDRITYVLFNGLVKGVIGADTMDPEGHAARVRSIVEPMA